jgi:hypothetical protein
MTGMPHRTARIARELDTAGIAQLAAFGGDWTMLLDDTSAIVYELGTRDRVFGGEQQMSSIGRRIAAFVHPDHIIQAVDRMEESLAAPGSRVRFEITAGAGDGTWRTVSVLAVNLLDDPHLNGVVLRVDRAD